MNTELDTLPRTEDDMEYVGVYFNQLIKDYYARSKTGYMVYLKDKQIPNERLKFNEEKDN